MNKFFNELIKNSRLLEVLYDNLADEIKINPLYKRVFDYLEEYASFNDLSAIRVFEIYEEFLHQFNKDCKRFVKSGKYPFESDVPQFTLERIEYDIVLMLSVLFSPHRYRIMQLLSEIKLTSQNALFIGLGPGLELNLLSGKLNKIDAYDLEFNDFLSKKFKNINLHQTLYYGQNKEKYDAIFLIELLEHLEDPYGLLKLCYDSLMRKGRIYLTTATNLPQFDHLFYFPEDHKAFEDNIQEMGFRIVSSERISHNFLAINVNSSNHFYILEKF